MAARTERPQKKQENYLNRRKERYMVSANNQQTANTTHLAFLLKLSRTIIEKVTLNNIKLS